MAIDKPRLVACPSCKAMTPYDTTNAFRPFCSQRCKLMDLGDWAAEKFRIPDHTPPELGDELDA